MIGSGSNRGLRLWIGRSRGVASAGGSRARRETISRGGPGSPEFTEFGALGSNRHGLGSGMDYESCVIHLGSKRGLGDARSGVHGGGGGSARRGSPASTRWATLRLRCVRGARTSGSRAGVGLWCAAACSPWRGCACAAADCLSRGVPAARAAYGP